MLHKLLFAIAFEWAWFGRRVSKWLTDKERQFFYVRAGKRFGCAVSYLYMGECIGFEKLLNQWAFWEKEYASRGYVTLSVDDFNEAGGHGQSINHLLDKRRADGEAPIFHATRYRGDSWARCLQESSKVASGATQTQMEPRVRSSRSIRSLLHRTHRLRTVDRSGLRMDARACVNEKKRGSSPRTYSRLRSERDGFSPSRSLIFRLSLLRRGRWRELMLRSTLSFRKSMRTLESLQCSVEFHFKILSCVNHGKPKLLRFLHNVLAFHLHHAPHLGEQFLVIERAR